MYLKVVGVPVVDGKIHLDVEEVAKWAAQQKVVSDGAPA